MATQFDQMQSPQPNLAKKPKRWLWIVGIVAALFVGVALGMGGQAEPEVVTKQVEVEPADMAQRRAALDSFDAELDNRETAIEEQQAKLDQREEKLDERKAALIAKERQIEANTIRDGIWTVGVDIKPGTYRATNVGSDCYWAITSTGSNGSDIIQNGIPGGGNPQVTVTSGQDFESQRCGDWRRK